jgi:hypothetical protein
MVPRRHSRSPPAAAPYHHTETCRRATPPSGPSQDRTAWVNQAMTIVRHGRDPELLCRPETDSASDCSRGDRDFADAKARPAGNALNSPSLAFDPGQPANNNWLLAFGWPWHEEQSIYRAQSGRDVRNHDAAQAACRRPPGARRREETGRRNLAHGPETPDRLGISLRWPGEINGAIGENRLISCQRPETTHAPRQRHKAGCRRQAVPAVDRP